MNPEETGMLMRDGFRCPICGFDAYCRIIVARPDHSRYVTSFYRCGGCQVMFHNPRTFSSNGDRPRPIT